MTRFDADDPRDRRKLFADAIAAHRTRASPFVTLEADTDSGQDALEPATDSGEDGDRDDDTARPWVQFGDNTFNLDVTDAELDDLKGLVGEFPEFRIQQLESPEEAEGTNARVTARSDPNRLATFADRVFLDVYDRANDYRAWVAEV
ncbi:hypothetical protein GCM10008995_04890 [Halobellus salinus]|uniref:DUF7975 domain-containing protein n=1 Tax=Halobellus salinus TaxID=931585 RepID=A0A830ECW3_9EURY|nr:hypothetical protein [Halobellus salinus]GGI98031.1 hypothetical protein GCM10008995_04890 [Halobellus salinus]SMP06725.1 hypothetical protein SAMN06265347_102189 [Halobellus salinus]